MMLITEGYRAQLAEMHAACRFSGVGEDQAREVLRLVGKVRARSVLDYGCGSGKLAERIGRAVSVRGYDPAVPGMDAEPEPADIVACIDVAEHIEPDCLHDVLAHMRQLTRLAAHVTVATRPADKRLPDGRNAHLIIDNAAWWHQQLARHWGQVSVRSVTPLQATFWGRP